MRVCDVGANPLSTPPYDGLVQDRVAEIIGFEPNPEAFAKLQEIKTDQETYFQQAVGREGKRSLHLHPMSGFSSLFPMDDHALRRHCQSKTC